MKNLTKVFVIFGLLLVSISSFAQKADSVSRKNVIKYNLTSHALYSSAILFQYERILSNRQSISIQLGQVHLPNILSRLEDIRSASDSEKSGYNVTIDYRFYLAKENKYFAPRGVYIAPFASIHDFKNIKEFEIKRADSDEYEPVVLNTKMDIMSAGVALGYQFVLWERMTLDFLLMGPSISNYRLTMEMDGDIPVEELDENVQEILENLADRFPFFNSIMEDNIAEFNGRTRLSSVGFRYSVSIGFRF